MTILLDFESRSRCDLKRRGGRLYWQHPSTEALCCVLHDTETGDRGVWLPGDPCPVSPEDELAAHNMMGFDRFGLARLGWRKATDPGLVDTSELARRAGLPGALDALGKRWLGLEKDKAGSRFTQSLSRPSRAKKRLGLLPDITPEMMARVISYCESDVNVMVHGWPLLESWRSTGPNGDQCMAWEDEVSWAERRVNDRGVAFDSALALRLLECDAINCEKALKREAREIGGGLTPGQLRDIVSSPEQFTEATRLPDAQKTTVEDALLDPQWREAWPYCRARQALASIARGKLEAGLARVSPDGRLRDSHRYVGAHTYRWSGRGMQLQNMPRPAKRFEDWGDAEVCALADKVLAGYNADPEEIELLLRACLYAPRGRVLGVCDFSGVEARGLAWCAGDTRALRVFDEGTLDPYKLMAATIFGLKYADIGKDERRQVGKIAELACGYGMGHRKFGDTALKGGVDLRKVGVDAKAVVDAWRKQHAPIVRFWYEIERAAITCAQTGRSTQADVFRFERSADGRDVAMFLPTGRPIVYNQVKVSPGRYGKPALSYLGTKQVREHTYGGKLTENAIQALCRDRMADCLIICEKAGLRPVLHIHDEIVCELDSAKDYVELKRIMTELPEWAEGFPPGAAGHTGVRYRK